MKVAKGKLISVEYSLFQDGPEGDLIEETTSEENFEFIFKEEEMLAAFEAELEGKEAGQSFSVSIKSDDAYGPEDPEAIIEFPKENFVVDGELDEELLQEGEVIPMSDDEGNELEGVVVGTSKETVTLDFNHPLAGIDLFFDGQIISVKETTAEDRERLMGGEE
ncbi:MAG: FKBP-type peptidyl-prolyl cis-trans isomerase SlyD [Flavobacteriales bacterium]|jgi:FKBP-type peptidyl-prolyl cis-trans isomerase SlyD